MLLQIYVDERWEPGTPCAWVLRDARQARLKDGESPFDALPSADAVEVVLAAGCALLTRIRLPARQPDKMRRLAPFALEEQAMLEPEAMHVTFGQWLDDDHVAVAVLARDWLSRLARHLTEAGRAPRRIRLETLAAPLAEGEWTLVVKADGGFVRTGPETGLALDLWQADAPPLGLGLALDEADARRPAAIRVRAAGVSGLPDLGRWSEALGVPVRADQPWDWSEPPARGGMDLLPGLERPAGRPGAAARRYRPAALLLLAALGIHVAAGAWDWLRLTRESQQLERQMARDFQQAFPDARVVVDAPLQFQRDLGALRSRAGALTAGDYAPLLAKIAPLVASFPGGEVRELRYQDNALNVDLTIAGRPPLQNLQNGLIGLGLKPEGVRLSPTPAGLRLSFTVRA